MRPPRSAVLEPPSAPPRPVRPDAKGRPGNGRPARPGTNGRPPAPGRRPKKASWLWRYRRVWFLFGLILLTALAGAIWVLTQIPLPPEAPQSQTTIIYDASGAQLATLHGQENRFPVRIDEVPPVVQNAIVAAEDRKFFEHGGIDPVGIARATWADIRQKGATQGGSTITQQYVKNVYVGRDPTLWRKLREAVISVKLERKLDKRQILERYINTVYFGRGAYGIQAAARTWFGKDVGALDLKESAYLAGLIRTPSGGDVVSDPETATQLRTFVLEAMLRSRYITPEQAAAVEAVPLASYVAVRTELDSTVTLQGVGAEYFVEYVRTQLLKNYSEDQVLRQGLRVQTSLDPTIQRQAYDAVYGVLDRDDDPAGALVAVDTEGRVVAMVGGRDWGTSKVNLAVGAPAAAVAARPARRSSRSRWPPPCARATRWRLLPRAGQARPPQGRQGQGLGGQQLRGGVVRQHQPPDATVNPSTPCTPSWPTPWGPRRSSTWPRSSAVIAAGAHLLDRPRHRGRLGDGHGRRLPDLPAPGMHVEPRVIRKITQNDSVLVDDRPKSTRVIDRSVAEKVNYALQQVVDAGSGTAAALPAPRCGARPAPPTSTATPGSSATPGS